MSKATRALVGHVLGMTAGLLVIAFAPRVMDAAICSFGVLEVLGLADSCSLGVANLGEGGLAVSWRALPWLLAVVVLMEAGLWVQRLYRAPTWAGIVVLLVGCPSLLFLTTTAAFGLKDSLVAGLVLGTPVALGASAYWLPFAAVRGQRSVCPDG